MRVFYVNCYFPLEVTGFCPFLWFSDWRFCNASESLATVSAIWALLTLCAGPFDWKLPAPNCWLLENPPLGVSPPEKEVEGLVGKSRRSNPGLGEEPELGEVAELVENPWLFEKPWLFKKPWLFEKPWLANKFAGKLAPWPNPVFLSGTILGLDRNEELWPNWEFGEPKDWIGGALLLFWLLAWLELNGTENMFVGPGMNDSFPTPTSRVLRGLPGYTWLRIQFQWFLTRT